MMLEVFKLLSFKTFAWVLATLGIGASPLNANQLQEELNSLAKAGGGVFRLSPGDRVIAEEGVIVPAGVTLDLNGGELVAVLTRADSAGVRLMSDATLRRGTVTVQSRGSPGTQSGSHAAVLVGALLGENPSVSQPSRFESPSGWVISEITARSDKHVMLGDGATGGAAAIQVMGGAHHGLIEKVTVPDSDVMAGGVMLDWGGVGAVRSQDVQGTAKLFLQGLAYTVHPHDIVIRDVRIGRLNRPSLQEGGSFGVRISGAHDISVSDVTIGAITEAGFLHTAGDLGYEFARPADRARGLRGIVVNRLYVAEAYAGHLVRTDSFADNVARAVAKGYRSLLDPIGTTDIAIRNVTGASSASAPDYGVRVNHQKGGTLSDVSARGFRRAFYIDEQVYDLTLLRPQALDSIEAAISIGHPHRPPARVTVVGAQVSGRRESAYLILVDNSDDVTLGRGNAHIRATKEARKLKID